MGDDLIEPPCEAIARRHVSLGCRAVSIVAPRRYERREVPVVEVEWDSEVSVPGVTHSFLCSMRHRSRLVKGYLGVVSLPGGTSVEGLEIHSPSRLPVLLCANNHAMTPCDRGGSWYLLDDAHTAVLVEAGLHVASPVNWDINRCVACDRLGVWVNH